MNKKLIVIAGAAVLIASLVFAGLAFAQTSAPFQGAATPTPTPAVGPGYGRMGAGNGMMGAYGRGGYGSAMMGGHGRGMRGRGIGSYGPMHDAMFDALASGLGITRADLDSRVARGESPAQIAASKGIRQADFAKILAEARKTAMDKAVADGYMTREQADWMLSHTLAPASGAGVGADFGQCPHFGSTPNS